MSASPILLLPDHPASGARGSWKNMSGVRLPELRHGHADPALRRGEEDRGGHEGAPSWGRSPWTRRSPRRPTAARRSSSITRRAPRRRSCGRSSGRLEALPGKKARSRAGTRAAAARGLPPAAVFLSACGSSAARNCRTAPPQGNPRGSHRRGPCTRRRRSGIRTRRSAPLYFPKLRRSDLNSSESRQISPNFSFFTFPPQRGNTSTAGRSPSSR